MKVELRNISRNSWSGLTKYKNCFDDLRPYLTRSGNLYTGLTNKDEERLGSKLGLDLKSNNKDFWINFFVRIGSKPLFLDTDDPMDELKYIFLSNHKRVKTSLLEHKAGANYILVNKDEEAKRDNIYGRIKRRAFKELDNMTISEMRKVLRLYGENGDSISNELVESKLSSLIEGNPKKFIDMWVENPNKELEFIIEKALSMNILRKNKNIYKYGSDIIGRSKDETILFFKDLKNQDIKKAILISIDSKSEIKDIDEKSLEEIEYKEKVKDSSEKTESQKNK